MAYESAYIVEEIYQNYFCLYHFGYEVEYFLEICIMSLPNCVSLTGPWLLLTVSQIGVTMILTSKNEMKVPISSV